MRRWFWIWLGVFWGCRLVVPVCAKEAPLALTTAAEVTALSMDAAKAHRAVQLRGVVTFTWHQGTSEFTLEDDTGAVWVSPVALPPQCVVGSRIELEGHTEAGAIGTILIANAMKVLGLEPLPHPRAANYEELFSDALHGMRVEVAGVVRGQRVNPEAGLGWLALEVATGGRRLTVNVTHEISGHPELVDARVRIRGVNLRALGRNQDGFLPVLNAHSLEDITVVDPPAAKPFELPSIPLTRVMRDSDAGGSGRRIHVKGVVSAVRSRDTFFLQDSTRGLQVRLREASGPSPGDVVEVIGFPEAGTFSPTLHDADWRPDSNSTVLEPFVTDSLGALRHDGRLLSLEGKVKSVVVNSYETALTLEDRLASFRVMVPGVPLANLAPGSLVKAVGVCGVEAADWEALVVRHQPTGFALLARTAKDVSLLESAPFWTPGTIAVTLAGGGCSLGALQGLLWLRARRRIRELSKSRDEAQALFQAILAERTRMAREIHDTLAQGFTAISAQLEVIHDASRGLSARAQKHLELARQLVRSSLEESRRSIWNLRAQTLEAFGISKALERLGEQLVSGTQIAFCFVQEGVERELSPVVENNVLRIGQEALTNAVRHGKPKRITCTLAFGTHAVCLHLQDDGVGFESELRAGSERGGFGLSGMRERAQDMGAQLEIQSHSGGGTQIRLTIPHA